MISKKRINDYLEYKQNGRFYTARLRSLETEILHSESNDITLELAREILEMKEKIRQNKIDLRKMVDEVTNSYFDKGGI